jgi:hypothetical protein
MKKINNKTKMIIGGLALIGLFFAYKKGVFGGSSEEPSDEPIVEKPKYVIPDKPTQASVPPADKPSATNTASQPVYAPAPIPSSGGANAMNWHIPAFKQSSNIEVN